MATTRRALQKAAATVTVEPKPGNGDAGKAAKDERYVLFIMNDCGGGMIDMDEVQDAFDKLSGIDAPPERVSVEVILSSPGGNPHAAYKLGKVLRARAGRVRFFVPEYAKSAATLLALSGDEILMSIDAELGPIDMQMEHMNLEGKGMLSALAAVQPINYFTRIADNLAESVATRVRGKYQLSRHEAIDMGLRYASSLLSPIMSKFEPSGVSVASRQLDVNAAYAQDLLVRYHFREPPPQNAAAKARDIALKLVHSYPDHAYVIWRDAARELGLRIGDAEKDPLWPAIEAAYYKCGGMGGRRIDLLPLDEFNKDYMPS